MYAEKTNYSDAELSEFKTLILAKLIAEKEELKDFQSDLGEETEKKSVLEDGAASLQRETTSQLAARKKKFIQQLEHALVRIENKTYGICTETGKLIPAGRLRAVLHTTKSMEAKLRAA